MTIPNILADRYASPEMAAIFDRRERVILERRFWIAVLEAQIELGLDVDTNDQVAGALNVVEDEGLLDLVDVQVIDLSLIHI